MSDHDWGMYDGSDINPAIPYAIQKCRKCGMLRNRAMNASTGEESWQYDFESIPEPPCKGEKDLN